MGKGEKSHGSSVDFARGCRSARRASHGVRLAWWWGRWMGRLAWLWRAAWVHCDAIQRRLLPAVPVCLSVLLRTADGLYGTARLLRSANIPDHRASARSATQEKTEKMIETIEQRVRRRSPYEVSCPKCGSTALAPCRFPSGQAVLPHVARLKVVARKGERPIMHDRVKLWMQMKNLADQLESEEGGS